MKIFFGLAFILASISCTNTPRAQNAVQEIAKRSRPTIAFVTYNFTRNEAGDVTVVLHDFKSAEGQLKDQDDDLNNDYAMLQLDAQGKVLEIHHLGNPMITDIEFINDNGDFERKTISQNSALFTTRIALNPFTQFLVLQSKMNGAEGELLKTDISQL